MLSRVIKSGVIFAAAVLIPTSFSNTGVLAQENVNQPDGVYSVEIDSPNVKRYLLADNSAPALLISFEIQVNFDGVTKDELHETFSDRLNDDAWYVNSPTSTVPLVTTLTNEGHGSRLLGRQWQQASDFGGFPVVDTITRIWADEGNANVDYGSQPLASYLTQYNYSNTETGSTLVYRGVYEPSPFLPLDEAGFTWFFGLVTATFENDMLAYFDTTGSATLNSLAFHTI